MSMTRKHFKAIAEILKRHKASHEMIMDFTKMLSDENDRFNVGTFLEACGYEDIEIDGMKVYGKKEVK